MKGASESNRSVCYRCFKPSVVCICDSLTRVDNRTRIFILQHPMERNHPIGTARLAMLGLKNVEQKIVYPNQAGTLETTIPFPAKTGLLYPSNRAVNLAEADPDTLPETLIVLDGTWFAAKKLYQENPWLAGMPHYVLRPSSPSRYRIRREPSMECISTLEAIVEALQILEPRTDCTPLLASFDQMIDRQIAFVERDGKNPRRKRPRRREKRSIPRALIAHFDRIVVMYSENLRTDEHQRVAASICAVRPADGATFECFIEVPAETADRQNELERGGILTRHQKEAIPVAEFQKKWRAFLRPDDILCTWNKGALKALFHICPHPDTPFLFLKAAYGNTVKEKFGHLEEVVSKLNLPHPPCPFTGRAATRMGDAVAMATWLHQLGNP